MLGELKAFSNYNFEIRMGLAFLFFLATTLSYGIIENKLMEREEEERKKWLRKRKSQM